MRLARGLPVLALVLGLTAACGGADPAPKPSPSASPTADLGAIVGKGYSFDPPTGWQKATRRFKKARPQTDQAAIATAPESGAPAYSDNVTVVVASAGTQKGDRDTLGPVARQALTKAEVTDIKIPPGTTDVDGRAATRANGRAEVGDAGVRISQLYVIHKQQLTVITFAFSEDTPEKKQEADINQLLTSWKWS